MGVKKQVTDGAEPCHSPSKLQPGGRQGPHSFPEVFCGAKSPWCIGSSLPAGLAF